MKIIGEGKAGLLLLSASRDELANMLGHYYATSDVYPLLKVGAEVKMSDVFMKAYELERRRKELTQAINSLRAVADYLEPVVPLAFPADSAGT